MEVNGELHTLATGPLQKESSIHGIGGWVGSKSWWEHFEEEENLLSLLGIETQIIQVIAWLLY
jgi:hypothetical protein